MLHTVARVVLEALLVLALSLVLLLAALLPFGAAPSEAPRLLFLFMDIGIAAWLVALAVLTARGSLRRHSSVVAALAGAALNLVVVIVVGLVQQGGWPGEFVGYALLAGAAFVVAVAAVSALLRVLPGR